MLNPLFDPIGAVIRNRHVVYALFLGVLATLGLAALLQTIDTPYLIVGLAAGAFGTLIVQFLIKAIGAFTVEPEQEDV